MNEIDSLARAYFQSFVGIPHKSCIIKGPCANSEVKKTSNYFLSLMYILCTTRPTCNGDFASIENNLETYRISAVLNYFFLAYLGLKIKRNSARKKVLLLYLDTNKGRIY